METTIVNVKKKFLNARQIANFKAWLLLPDTVYIGRNMSFYVDGAVQSKWANPYKLTEYAGDDCCKLYEKYILSSKLYEQILELEGKELGCWCKPDRCHGDILIKLLHRKKIEDCGIGTVVRYINMQNVERPAGQIIKIMPEYFIYQVTDLKIRVRYSHIKKICIIV